MGSEGGVDGELSRRVHGQYWFPVGAGDLMFSNVYDNRDGTWTAVIEDYTLSRYKAVVYSGPPSQSSADWVVEAQAGSPLPSFTPSVDFSSAGWFVNYSGTEQVVDSSYAGTTWMLQVQRSGTCLTPSTLTDGTYNSSFTVRWGC